MPFDILTFKNSGLVRGGARQSMFQVTLATGTTGAGSTAAPAFPAGATTKLPFVCRAASLPGMLVSPIRVPYYGRFIKVAGDRDFDDWTITIMNDEDFMLRDTFETWSNWINTLESNVRQAAYPTENYKADFTVNQFDKEGEIIRSYNLVGAWPQRITAIDLDWEAQNQIEVFQVVLSYDYWLPNAAGATGGVSTLSYTGIEGAITG